MKTIKQSFKIKYLPENILIMYSRLSDGTYAKTIDTPDGIKSSYIDIQEFASGLASLLLRPK